MSFPAEGTSNPYWDSPENEGARMERVRAIVGRQPDANKIAFFVGKSNNDNFVAYKWTGSGIEAFWISTQNVVAERRDPLNLAEELLYGVDVKVTSTGEWLVNLRADGIRHKVMRLTLDSADTPMLCGPINGEEAVLDSAYVQMKQGLIPDVDFVRLYGRTVQGADAQEIIRK